jgi:drug/metabolite transporter (DMT)-like permease
LLFSTPSARFRVNSGRNLSRYPIVPTSALAFTNRTYTEMFYLLLAILGSGVIPVIFRAFDRFGVNLFWAIPANYVTCVVIGNFWAGNTLESSNLASQPWIGFAAVQGMLLAVNFYLLAYTAQRAGVAVAALASRLSVAIPSLLAFVLYGDSLSLVKIAGLCAALLALYLCTAPDKKSSATTVRLFQLMPILVFITFGCYFSILKYLQAYYLDSASYHAYVMSGFIFAFASSIIIGISRRVFSPRDFRMKHIYAGIFLGGINYVAVYALLEVLALKGWESSQLFPIYSVGVVAVSAILAMLFFRERLSGQRMAGLAVGLVAVGLLNR